MIDYGKLNADLEKEANALEVMLKDASLEQILKMKDLINYTGTVTIARCGYQMKVINHLLKQRGIIQ